MPEKKSRKRKLGSYPFFSVVFSVILSLLVIGLFGLLLVLTNSLTTIIQESVEIQVYLDKPIRNNEVSRIHLTIGSKPYILNNADDQSIVHISKDEAAKQFIADTGEDFTEFLGENPLRDLLIVKINPSYQSLDSLNMIKSEIETIGGVYEVSFVESLVESINSNLTKIGAFLIGFSILLTLVVVILINNTIKLALFSQRFLIRSMQLVGATSGFIRRPFLYRAVLYGFGAGLVASAILYGVLAFANTRIEDLAMLQSQEKLFTLFGVLVILGIVVTFTSTFLAMKRYLKTSLDELY